MTRPRYLPTPAIEILRREIPGLPWESPSGADVSTAEGWIAAINKAVAPTPGGPIICTREANGWWKMSHGDVWRGGESLSLALDRLLSDITHSGKLEVPDVWPDFWPPLVLALAAGFALGLTVVIPVDGATALGQLLRGLASLFLLVPISGWTALRIARVWAIRKHRRALAIAELMRRPLPWLATTKGPQAEAGSLSLAPPT